MASPIISVEKLSKRYLIGHANNQNQVSSYTALRDILGREARRFTRNITEFLHGRPAIRGDTIEEFWALTNISFEVNEGEVLGIIGRNGAGKSTLLKVLSRITEPSAGRVILRGRVASLLEVGTGFHPELTGRENIFLNGAILGMSRAEIRKKFDEIVAFAEVERFLDTPVKRYSSGMYVRLAFAVAAHLDPEILIVDEVLAVGDFEFQKKCLGKMEEVSRRQGRTVLFVSHNMAAVADLTTRAILLRDGALATHAETPKVIAEYLSRRALESVYTSSKGETEDEPHIARAEVVTSRPQGIQNADEPLEIKIWIRHRRPIARACLGIQIINQLQAPALALYAYPPEYQFGNEPGTTLVQFFVPKIRLNRGHFRLRIWLTQPTGGEVYEMIDGICGFEVVRLHDHAIIRNWPIDACVYHDEFLVKVRKHPANLPTAAAIALV